MQSGLFDHLPQAEQQTWQYELVEEYVGHQRDASAVRTIAVASTIEAMQQVFDQEYRPMYCYILKDWNTGKTLQVLR